MTDRDCRGYFRQFPDNVLEKCPIASGVQATDGRGLSPNPGQSTEMVVNVDASCSVSGRISARVEIEAPEAKGLRDPSHRYRRQFRSYYPATTNRLPAMTCAFAYWRNIGYPPI